VISMATSPRLKTFGAFALILLGAALLSGCTSPQVCKGGVVTTSFTDLWETWQGLIYMGVTMIFLVSGFVYMLSSLVRHRGLMKWSQDQFYEGVATLVLAFFAMSLVGFACSTDVTLLDVDCPEGDVKKCNTFYVADSFLNTFRDKINTFFWEAFALNMFLSALASTTISFAVSSLGPTISIGQGLSFFTSQLTTGLTLVVGMQLITTMQILLLKISSRLFGFLLPAGILLRSFGITRGFGGSLIAIALGFYLIYPLAIVLSYGMVLDKVDAQFQADPGDPPTDEKGDWGATSSWFCGFLGILIVGAILVPFIVFVILIAFVKGLSSAIGEEVDVSNLTRLI